MMMVSALSRHLKEDEVCIQLAGHTTLLLAAVLPSQKRPPPLLTAVRGSDAKPRHRKFWSSLSWPTDLDSGSRIQCCDPGLSCTWPAASSGPSATQFAVNMNKSTVRETYPSGRWAKKFWVKDYVFCREVDCRKERAG